jgi:hypothetical protein
MRIKRITAFILALMLLTGSVSAIGETDGEFGDELTPEQYEFIYNEKNYMVPFSRDFVVVVLKSGISIDDVSFPGIGITGIEVADNGITDQGDSNNCVLFLDLEERSRESVLTVIEALKDNPYVLYAEPAYWISYAHETGWGASTDSVNRIRGDLNFDGRINNADIIIVARYIVRLTSLTYSQVRCADMNDDNRVNNIDLVILAKKVIGL